MAAVHVVCVAGTRPNLVKLAPVVAELERREVDTTFVDAAQHYDDVLSGEIRRDLGLRDPDVVLHTGSGTHAEQLARVATAFEPLLDQMA
ncbi:UDP-N-acetylglucosamine 2-epimerase (non-hydrolyzing), partial [cyanobacterium TDX16]